MKHLIKLDSELRRVLKKRPTLSDHDMALTDSLRWMSVGTHQWIDDLISIGFKTQMMSPYVVALVDAKRKLIIKLSYFVNKKNKPLRRVPTLTLSQKVGRRTLVLQPLVDTDLSPEQIDFIENLDYRDSEKVYGNDAAARNMGHLNGEIVVFDW